MRKVTLADALDLFLLDCRSRRLKTTTTDHYQKHLGYFLTWLESQDVSHIHEAKASHIRLYLVEMQDRGLSGHTVHITARTIRTFCRYMVRDELLERNPFNGVVMPKLDKKILPAFTNEEVRAIFDACVTERNLAICMMLHDSGLRAEELLRLTRGHIDLDRGTVTVLDGKGGKDRVTHIGAKTRKQLGRYFALERGEMGEKSRVFVSEKKRTPLTYHGLLNVCKKLRKATGVRHIKPHTFRRTFALNCLRNGMNIYVLARLMGHSDITVLRQYLDLLDDDLSEAHGQHGPGDNL